TEGHLTLRLQAVFRSDPIQRCIQSQIGWWLRIHLPAVCPPRGIRILTGVEISHPETRYFSNLEIACHSQLNTGRDIDIGSCVSTGTGSGILSRNHRVKLREVSRAHHACRRTTVTIEKGVRTGEGATILPGAHVALGQVLDAGSVVTVSTLPLGVVARV